MPSTRRKEIPLFLFYFFTSNSPERRLPIPWTIRRALPSVRVNEMRAKQESYNSNKLEKTSLPDMVIRKKRLFFFFLFFLFPSNWMRRVALPTYYLLCTIRHLIIARWAELSIKIHVISDP